MSASPEDFDKLRKLLKLKRHEQPPPRYFNDFSDHVLARIREESADTAQDRVWREAPWLRRFFQFLETNSLAAGGFATGICALMVGGIVYSEYSDHSSAVVTNGDGAQMLAQQVSSPFGFEQPANSQSGSISNAVLGQLGVPGISSLGSGVSVTPVSLNLGVSH